MGCVCIVICCSLGVTWCSCGVFVFEWSRVRYTGRLQSPPEVCHLRYPHHHRGAGAIRNADSVYLRVSSKVLPLCPEARCPAVHPVHGTAVRDPFAMSHCLLGLLLSWLFTLGAAAWRLPWARTSVAHKGGQLQECTERDRYLLADNPGSGVNNQREQLVNGILLAARCPRNFGRE